MFLSAIIIPDRDRLIQATPGPVKNSAPIKPGQSFKNKCRPDPDWLKKNGPAWIILKPNLPTAARFISSHLYTLNNKMFNNLFLCPCVLYCCIYIYTYLSQRMEKQFIKKLYIQVSPILTISSNVCAVNVKYSNIYMNQKASCKKLQKFSFASYRLV